MMVSLKGQTGYITLELKGIPREEKGVALTAELQNFTVCDSTEITYACKYIYIIRKV